MCAQRSSEDMWGFEKCSCEAVNEGEEMGSQAGTCHQQIAGSLRQALGRLIISPSARSCREGKISPFMSLPDQWGCLTHTRLTRTGATSLSTRAGRSVCVCASVPLGSTLNQLQTCGCTDTLLWRQQRWRGKVLVTTDPAWEAWRSFEWISLTTGTE